MGKIKNWERDSLRGVIYLTSGEVLPLLVDWERDGISMLDRPYVFVREENHPDRNVGRYISWARIKEVVFDTVRAENITQWEG